jgi:hypothetical protein
VHYLLDGYNLAHWLAGDRDLGPEALRELLLAALAERRPRDARELTIFWDARGAWDRAPSNAYGAGVEERFVPVADDAIVDLVAESPRPRDLKVVSRDREVTGRARQLGARTAGPAELLGGAPRRGH